MNKKDLIDGVAERTGYAKTDVKTVIDEFVKTLQEGLSEGEKVLISGHGTYEMKTRKARVARNPKTGEIVNVPEKLVPVWKPSKKLKIVV